MVETTVPLEMQGVAPTDHLTSFHGLCHKETLQFQPRAQQPLAHIIEGFSNTKEERKTLLAVAFMRFYLSGEGLEINATNYGKACVILCERLRWYCVSNCP